MITAIEKAYKKKTDIQAKEFKEKVEQLYASGLGAHGIEKAIADFCKIYGIQ